MRNSFARRRQLRPFYRSGLKRYREKIAVEIPAGRASLSNDVKILFSEWPIERFTDQYLS